MYITNMYVYIYIYLYVHIYRHTQTHTHTHTRTNPLRSTYQLSIATSKYPSIVVSTICIHYFYLIYLCS